MLHENSSLILCGALLHASLRQRRRTAGRTGELVELELWLGGSYGHPIKVPIYYP